jgi:hypothetical protein
LADQRSSHTLTPQKNVTEEDFKLESLAETEAEWLHKSCNPEVTDCNQETLDVTEVAIESAPAPSVEQTASTIGEAQLPHHSDTVTDVASQATEIEADELLPQLLQLPSVETAPTELEEEYTVINADADGWGEILREEARALRCCVGGAALKELAQIAPTNPVEIELEAAELPTVVETPQVITAEPVEPVEASFDEEV